MCFACLLGEFLLVVLLPDRLVFGDEQRVERAGQDRAEIMRLVKIELARLRHRGLVEEVAQRPAFAIDRVAELLGDPVEGLGLPDVAVGFVHHPAQQPSVRTASITAPRSAIASCMASDCGEVAL